jgi:hypothetical protein
MANKSQLRTVSKYHTPRAFSIQAVDTISVLLGPLMQFFRNQKMVENKQPESDESRY